MNVTSSKAQKKDLLIEAIGWDYVNWVKAIPFWEETLGNDLSTQTALEIGAGENGGLSLWLADRGASVKCSGYSSVSQEARSAHDRFCVSDRIEYIELDATCLKGVEKYDIVALKSVLGGIVRDRGLDFARQVVEEISKAVLPGGRLLFAENLVGTRFHQYFRKHFGAGRNDWRYFQIDELLSLYSGFASVEYRVFGFTGCFGPTETLRRLLGKFDSVVADRVLPPSWRYVMAGIAVM
jgi:SAM-dependent methyltransferase